MRGARRGRGEAGAAALRGGGGRAGPGRGGRRRKMADRFSRFNEDRDFQVTAGGGPGNGAGGRPLGAPRPPPRRGFVLAGGRPKVTRGRRRAQRGPPGAAPGPGQAARAPLGPGGGGRWRSGAGREQKAAAGLRPGWLRGCPWGSRALRSPRDGSRVPPGHGRCLRRTKKRLGGSAGTGRLGLELLVREGERARSAQSVSCSLFLEEGAGERAGLCGVQPGNGQGPGPAAQPLRGGVLRGAVSVCAQPAFTRRNCSSETCYCVTALLCSCRENVR